MYKQGDREYELKGSYLELKTYFGDLSRRLRVLVTKYKGDGDFDALEKYQRDMSKLGLNVMQIDEMIESIEEQIASAETDDNKRELLAKIPELKQRRNYDSLKANYEACKEDFKNDRLAQRQLQLENDFYSDAIVEICQNETLIMPILKKILTGDVDNLTYDLVFAIEVLTAFFIFVRQSNPLLKSLSENIIVS